MTTRLRKDWTWLSVLVWDGKPGINTYYASTELATVTDDQYEQAIAYQRMRWFMNDVLSQTVLIQDNDPMLPIYRETGFRILALPEAPVDQIIGMMLYSKLNAIMQKRMIVVSVDVSSWQGDDMIYMHDMDDDLIALDRAGWWNDSRPIWTTQENRKSNVIALEEMTEWSRLGMGWEQSQDSADNNVVFAKFDRDEDK